MNRHISALDGVRGFAISSVLLFHFGTFLPHGPVERAVSAIIGFGWSGVDLFFCLSGFLITGILLRTIDHPGYCRLFYARRVLRIFPVYYFFLVLTLLELYIFHRLGYFRHTTASRQVWAWSYLANWRDSGLPHSDHLWSLAIEEQFYLVWPLAILVFRRRVLPFCLGVAAFSLVARLVAVYSFGWGDEAIHRMTPFRLDGLALGGVAACIAASPALERVAKNLVPWVFGLAFGTVLLITLRCGTSALVSPMNTIGYTVLAIGFSSLILQCAITSDRMTSLFLLTGLRHLGKYSYGIYVFHYVLVRPAAVSLSAGMLRIVGGTIGSYMLARISWRFIETPFLRIKQNFEYLKAAPELRAQSK